MNITEELRQVADLIGAVWGGDDSISGEAIEQRLRLIAAKCEGKVLVPPIAENHPQGYLTGKTHFVARIGATGNFYGKTADEALANLRVAVEPAPTAKGG